MKAYTDRETADFLAACKTIAIVGLSDEPSKDSHRVASYLQSQGYDIIPVNPNERSVLGRASVDSLLTVQGSVDLVVVFRKPEAVPEIVKQAQAIHAKGIWLQLGITSDGAEQAARAAGLFVVSNRCVMTEHRRLLESAQL